jgi:hypothetical protein
VRSRPGHGSDAGPITISPAFPHPFALRSPPRASIITRSSEKMLDKREGKTLCR